MKLTWTLPLRQYIHMILQEAGYHFFIDPRTQKESFVMRVGRGFYPRFHIYIATAEDQITIDVHIDQTKQSLGSRAHAGEYVGRVVEEEAARLIRWLEYYKT